MANNEFSFPCNPTKRQRLIDDGASPGPVEIAISIRPSNQDCLFGPFPVTLAAAMILAPSLSSSSVLGADVTSCFLRKNQGFNQTSSGAPVWWSFTPFGLWVDAYTDSSNSVTAAAVLLPDGSSRSLFWTNAPFSQSGYTFRDSFTNTESLDANYSDGRYTLIPGTVHDGSNSIPLNLLPDTCPNAPWVSNFAAAQSVDPAADFRLQWTPFLGATTNDDVRVELWPLSASNILAFGSPTNPPFSGTNTSIVIPRNTLALGQTYVGFLVFRRTCDLNTNSYRGVACSAAHDTYTVFRLRTIAPPVLQLAIAHTTATLSWPKVFQGFAPQGADALGPFPEWFSVANVPETNDDAYVVTVPLSSARKFYRLKK